MNKVNGVINSIGEYIKDWWYPDDGRKREYGSIKSCINERNKIKSTRVKPSQRYNYRVRKPVKERTSNVLNKQKNNTDLWNRIKSIFNQEEQDLQNMKHAYSDFRLVNPTYKCNSLNNTTSMVAQSEIFKKKLLEKKYDDRMRDQLRRGRSKKQSKPLSGLPTSDSDQIILLKRKLDILETDLERTNKELQITKKKLAFAQEKNQLFESLINDTQVDDNYVKSRRRISNLQKDNQNLELKSLSPSPIRRSAISPLFTSSPIRFNLKSDSASKYKNEHDDKFYKKYPNIPQTKQLTRHLEESLSPIRVDYSKYSS